MSATRFDVFGRKVLVTRSDGHWQAFYLGDEGKRRRAPDIVIPAETAEQDLALYLADLCHEWATSAHPEVREI